MSNNFTIKAENALNRAVTIAESYGHTYIGTEHVLLALAEDETSCASILLKKSKLTYEKICEAVKEYSGVGTLTRLSSKDTTPKCRRLLEQSYKISKKYNSEKIGTEHILLALLEERECVATKILTKVEADSNLIKDNVITFLRSSQRGILFAEAVSEINIPNLTKYGKNLTALAEAGKLDPVIGRDNETERLIRTLSRRTKNNPCLIGEAGVGKTAIVEGLAQRIYEGSVPYSLSKKIIISLDLTSMVAGAKYRGDFEERIKLIMTEATKNPSVILFIDEIHTIVGAGSAEGAIDAANIMKPELSRGDIQLIGATTLNEYQKYIEKDSALERRFQPILVEEPSTESSINMLKGLKNKFEKHHGVSIDDSAIESAVRLSQRYVQDRFLPDKAIDIIDEACAVAYSSVPRDSQKIKNIKEKMRQIAFDRKSAIDCHDYELATNLRELESLYSDELTAQLKGSRPSELRRNVSSADVERVVSEITGVSFGLKKDSSSSGIKSRLSESVIGQEAAISALSNAVTRSLAGINSPDRPRGIFLFLGESGVGKTALANSLSEVLFDSEEALIRYDMSEYAESYTVSKLIGSAPGYVGYGEQVSALERLRRHPYSVVLLDEIEKCHRDVLSLFLQIFDNGVLTDASGRKINFKNTYIIMTSNIGADRLRKGSGLGFLAGSEKDDIRKVLRESFSDEFINRIDEIILFSPLDNSALKQIAKIKVSELAKRISDKGINVEFDDCIYDFLANKAKNRAGLGARPLIRIIVLEIENKIADMIVSGKASVGDSLLVTADENGIFCTKPCLALN